MRAWMAALRDVGVEITHDWTACVESHLAAGGDAALSPEDRERFAYEDLAGVDHADIVWLLAPVTLSRGSWFEAGYARGRGKLLGVSGRGAARSIFTALAARCFETDAEAFAAIHEHAELRAGRGDDRKTFFNHPG